MTNLTRLKLASASIQTLAVTAVNNGATTAAEVVPAVQTRRPRANLSTIYVALYRAASEGLIRKKLNGKNAMYSPSIEWLDEWQAIAFAERSE